MTKRYQRALFIHRRDLRVQDNTALNEAMTCSNEVLSCFIFDPVQVGTTNEYRSDRHVQFMIESLQDLAEQYKKVDGTLHTFTGKPKEVVAVLIADAKIDAVYVNADYTPYARTRDAAISAACEKNKIPFFAYHDLLLSGDPELVKTGMKKPFTVFTPYWRRTATIEVPKPVALRKGTFVTALAAHDYHTTLETFMPTPLPEPSAEKGGRVVARAVLKEMADFSRYAASHHMLTEETTRLSAHNKFGTVSIREVYHAMGAALGYQSALIRQLYWRDFYMAIVYFFPHVIGHSFDTKHEILYGKHDPVAFKKWQEGMTGIPVVDAGMRELLHTGYMHNRARLIVGSFLTKDLHEAWWHGEKHFAQHLVDYDISLNNGNWQWVGGTGVDPTPYFRIFNPWLQGKKFDPKAEYIKKWVPELRDATPAQIHAAATKPLPESLGYPEPMVDHTTEMRKVRALYVPND